MLDEEELQLRALAMRSAQMDLAEYDLGLFIEVTTPEYERPDHLAPLLEALDRSMREPVYALVEIPPRMGKTESILHGLVRRLRYRPHDAVAYCAYAASLALKKSRNAREIAGRAGVWTGQEKRIRQGGPAQAVSYWETSEGGSFSAGGRLGSFVGSGFQTVVFDDPLKNRDEAESPVIQERAIETWRMLATRIEPGGSGFVTHQAWNDFDPIAVLKEEMKTGEGQPWEVISLPAVIDAVYDDKTGRIIGGTPLWPARWSLEALDRRKHDVGEYNWFSQYTNDRKPRGTTIFGEPARYIKPHIDGAVVVISCDPGIEADQMKDSSGIVVASIYREAGPHHTPKTPQLEPCMDILLAEDQWMTIPDLLDYLVHLQTVQFRGAPILLEEVSAFKVLSQIAQRLSKRVQIYPVTPKGSKWLRAQPAALAWNKGRIRTPMDAPWVAGFHNEARRFTGKPGGHDNRVDAMTQLYDYSEHVLAALAGARWGGEVTMASSPF